MLSFFEIWLIEIGVISELVSPFVTGYAFEETEFCRENRFDSFLRLISSTIHPHPPSQGAMRGAMAGADGTDEDGNRSGKTKGADLQYLDVPAVND